MRSYIEQLALHKDFAALTAEEQASVLAEMPAEEYAQLCHLLRVARQMEAEAQPPARLRSHLLARMSEQTRPNTIHRMLTFNVPAWQAAAVLILGITTAFWMKKEAVVEKTVTAYQLRVDTVLQEKIQWRDRVVVKNRVVFREKEPAQPMVYVPEKIDSLSFMPEFKTVDLSDDHVGTSLGDAPELMDFFTQSDK